MRSTQSPQIYVIHANSMEGPWSEPTNLGISGHIDPGHVVGEDGRRYLFLSGVSRVRLGAVTVARSRSVHGPWGDCPANPIIRTWDAKEPWWSRGHATLFEGSNDQWWAIYHGYENGLTTLGRQTLLEPIEWDAAAAY